MLNRTMLPYTKKPTNYKLPEDLFLDQWTIPAGTIIKLYETQNFGWIVLPSHLNIPKRIFKY